MQSGMVKAENISIILRAVDGVYRISIIDDGCGCKKINKGFGLLGIEERINKPQRGDSYLALTA